MRTLVVQRIIRRTSVIACLFGFFLCVAYYFDKDVELGTLLYFYLLIAGGLSIISLVVLLVAGVMHWAERKRLLRTLAIIALVYVSLLVAGYFVFDLVEPINKYALP